MKVNMSTTDRTIRSFIAIALVAFILRGSITDIWSTAAYIVAAVFLATSLMGFCPIYAVLGVSTCAAKKG